MRLKDTNEQLRANSKEGAAALAKFGTSLNGIARDLNKLTGEMEQLVARASNADAKYRPTVRGFEALVQQPLLSSFANAKVSANLQ